MEMLANTGYDGREKYTSLEVVIFLKHFLSLAFEEGELLAQTRKNAPLRFSRLVTKSPRFGLRIC